MPKVDQPPELCRHMTYHGYKKKVVQKLQMRKITYDVTRISLLTLPLLLWGKGIKALPVIAKTSLM